MSRCLPLILTVWPSRLHLWRLLNQPRPGAASRERSFSGLYTWPSGSNEYFGLRRPRLCLLSAPSTIQNFAFFPHTTFGRKVWAFTKTLSPGKMKPSGAAVCSRSLVLTA